MFSKFFFYDIIIMVKDMIKIKRFLSFIVIVIVVFTFGLNCERITKELEDYITSDKAYGMVVEGEDAITTMRGAIKQIRSDVPSMLGEEPRMTENVIHGSDCVSSAENEIAIFNTLKRTNVR